MGVNWRVLYESEKDYLVDNEISIKHYHRSTRELMEAALVGKFEPHECVSWDNTKYKEMSTNDKDKMRELFVEFLRPIKIKEEELWI